MSNIVFSRCTVFVNGVCTSTYHLSKGERVDCAAIPFDGKPFSCALYFEGEELKAKHFDVCKTEGNFYLAPKSEVSVSTKVYAQEIFMRLGKEIRLTLFSEEEYAVSFDSDSGFRCYRIKGKPVDWVFGCDGDCTVVYFKCRIDAEYYLLAVSSDTFAKVAELYGNELAIEGNTVKMTKYCPDIKRRRKKQTMFFDNGKLKNAEVVFECAPVHVCTDELTGWMFLEALMAGDDAEAKQYLSEELRGSFTDIKGFLGTIEYLYPSDKGIEAVGEKHALIMFELNNGKIIDILQSE